MKYRLLLLISLFISVGFIATFSLAQAQSPDGLTDLIITPSSENPSPGQQITISVKSYSIDINSAKITWIVDGVSKSTGTGLKTFTMTAPQGGKKSTVQVRATTPEGKTVSSSISVGSGSIDLIIETDGYVPPSYRGRLYPVFQNAVDIIAIPHLSNSSGTEYDPKTLVYTWKQNEKVLDSDSGYGKQKISISGTVIPRPYNISVVVETKDSSAQASALTSVDARDPIISFYIDDPLYGPLYNRAVNGSIIVGSTKETTVFVAPFGLNSESSSLNNLKTKWFIGDSEHSELASKRSVILRSSGDTSGGSRFELELSNPEKILQTARGYFSAAFISKSNTAESVNFYKK